MKKEIKVFISENWDDYELLDSGNGKKLERFGSYTFIRPESSALWSPQLPEKSWKESNGEFKSSNDKKKAGWHFPKQVPERWKMEYKGLKFYAEPTPFRHLGVFPEQANHWDFIMEKIKNAGREIKVLNLFGYTGIASLAAASAGAKVTHVDASKKIITWARENQKLSGLENKEIRWILDDALKFLEREMRRGEKYTAVIIDPPKFGRGPKGEVWNIEENLPELLHKCKKVLSDQPLFFIATLYSVNFSALSLDQIISEAMATFGGKVESGELAILEKSAGRLLSTAITSRWF